MPLLRERRESRMDFRIHRPQIDDPVLPVVIEHGGKPVPFPVNTRDDILTDIRHVDCTRHMIDNPEPCNFVNCSVLSCTEHLLVLLLFLIRRVSSKDRSEEHTSELQSRFDLV